MTTASLIVDVGANAGYTTVELLPGCLNAHVVAVDANDERFKCLSSNQVTLHEAYPEAVVGSTCCLVGSNVSGVFLQENGSAMLLEQETSRNSTVLHSRTLDEVIYAWKRESALREPVRLIKCYVDGYNHNVLMSGLKAIENDKPILYFECQTNTIEDVASYMVLYDALVATGCGHIYAFDNIGGYIEK